MFSVCVLTYGNHPDVLDRCLGGLWDTIDTALVADIRVGLNAVTPGVRVDVEHFAREIPVPCHVYEPADGLNAMKYPLMRRMLYDPARPLAGSYVMWFDDDSYVHRSRGRGWWPEVAAAVADKRPAVMGSLYLPAYRWNEHEQAAIEKQPWCRLPKALQTRPKFATGGWWVADKEFLARWDYPFRELRHNGGDVLLGELCRQQRANLVHYNAHVAINADAEGRESKARRRGLTSPRPFEAPPPYNYKHHDFAVGVKSFSKRVP